MLQHIDLRDHGLVADLHRGGDAAARAAATAAVMVPGVKLVPLTNSPATSSRGTVAKAPMERVVALRLEVVSSLVIAWDRMVPVLSRPPVVASVPGVVGRPCRPWMSR